MYTQKNVLIEHTVIFPQEAQEGPILGTLIRATPQRRNMYYTSIYIYLQIYSLYSL